MWSLIQHVSVWPIPFGDRRVSECRADVSYLGLTYAAWVPIFTAGTLVMIPKYDPDEVVRGLAEHRVSIFCRWPGAYLS